MGAPNENGSGNYEGGSAYTFNATTGALIKTLTSPSPQDYGNFGDSVAINGNTVLVGAPGENASGYVGSGNVYIFNAMTGALIDKLTSPNAQTRGQFGSSVSISGDTIAVGAQWENVSGFQQAGRAYTFNASTGALINTLANPSPQRFGFFGYSVAASANIVVVGAWGELVSHAYTFNATTGALISTLSPNAQGPGNFGYSVAASGSTVLVGAPIENVSGYGVVGNAYTFNAATGALISTLTSPNPQQQGSFGYSVAISGGTIVVGALGEFASGNNSAAQLGAHTFSKICSARTISGRYNHFAERSRFKSFQAESQIHRSLSVFPFSCFERQSISQKEINSHLCA